MTDITVIMTTWLPPSDAGQNRCTVNVRTVRSWKDRLVYRGGTIRLHVADDGSDPIYGLGVDFLPVKLWEKIFEAEPRPVTTSRQERRGVGASLNAGIREAANHSPLFGYFVDDWELDGVMDLTPWAQLLMTEEDIGMIRLGPPHPGITGEVRMFPTGWAFVVDRHHYAFGFRPALYHQRFIDAYGWFSEGTSSLECERQYNEHFARTPGPEIVYALPYPWVHVGAEDGDELSAITPGVPDE